VRNIDPSLIVLLDQVRKTYESIPERFRKEAPIHVLTRVVAHMVPGLQAVDGDLSPSDRYSWLILKANAPYIIDLDPVRCFPGPIIVHTDHPVSVHGWYLISEPETEKSDSAHAQAVAEIVDATEGAKRFLSMP